jgi:hypothetical protein
MQRYVAAGFSAIFMQPLQALAVDLDDPNLYASDGPSPLILIPIVLVPLILFGAIGFGYKKLIINI